MSAQAQDEVDQPDALDGPNTTLARDAGRSQPAMNDEADDDEGEQYRQEIEVPPSG